jgi:hypothetical protein
MCRARYLYLYAAVGGGERVKERERERESARERAREFYKIDRCKGIYSRTHKDTADMCHMNASND